MYTVFPAVEPRILSSRFFRRAFGSAVLFAILVLAAGTGSAGDASDCQPGKIKNGGKFTDDPLPDKLPDGWAEYVQEKYKAYSIWLPKKGRNLLQTEGSVEVKVSPTRTAKLGFVILKCDIKNDIKLNIQRFIFPLQKGEMIDADATIEAFRDLHMEEYEGAITEQYDLMLGRMPGKEYRVDLKSGEKSRVRIYQIGKAVWRIWVTGTKEQVMGDTTKLIFSSFKNQILLKDKKP